jgi:hypothetical protein
MYEGIDPVVPSARVAMEDPALGARIVARHRLPGVSAGSVLLAVGSRLLAVQDDAFRVTWIDPESLALEAVMLRGDGAPLPKPVKPDFEAAVATPGGTIYVVGSGSLPTRCSIARLSGTGVSLYEHPRLYDCVAGALGLAGRPNVEGAAIAGDRLRLFQRGAPSGCVELPLASLDGAAPVALAAFVLDLGALDGIPLGITDVATLGPGHCAFVAAAEDTPDAIADGPVAGSVIGEWREQAGGAHRLRWTRLPGASKVEGLVVDADRRGGWILTDADDAALESELCRIELAGFP